MEKLRQLVYPGTDVFIVCFSLVEPSSFNKVNQYVTELNASQLDVPLILVGTKRDLRIKSADTDAGYLSSG